MDKIYSFLKSIPKWKVISYKAIWEYFSLHPRAIARILSQNQNQDIFPCYKVVNQNWKIWWYNLWENIKIERLLKDWIDIKNWKIDKSYFWKP